MSTIHTRNGAVYLGTGTPTPVAEVTEWSLDVDFDTVDDSAMGDTWETRAKGALRFSGSITGNFDDAATQLWDCATSFTATKAYFYIDRSATGRYYYGSIWPKLGLSASRTDIGKSSMDFDGNGELAAE